METNSFFPIFASTLKLIPAAFLTLSHNLSCLLENGVHPPCPLHLIISFQFLIDAIGFSQLFNQPSEYFLRLPVNIRQIIVQPAGQQQRGISTVLMLTEIPAVVLSPNANRFAVRHGQAGELILPALLVPLLVPQAVFRIKGVLFHHRYLVSFLFRVVRFTAFACSTNASRCCLPSRLRSRE